MTDAREELATRFRIPIEAVDRWLARAAADSQQVGWLPYEPELMQLYGWASQTADEFIKALIAAVRPRPAS